MKLNELINIFEHYSENTDESLKFERIENPSTKCPDLLAFMLLDKLIPSDNDIISAAEHDVIYLQTDINALAEVITEADCLTLIRCGVFYDSGYECLYMFT